MGQNTINLAILLTYFVVAVKLSTLTRPIHIQGKEIIMEHAQEFVDAAEEGEIEDVISFCKMGVNVNVQVGYVSALPCCQTRDTVPVL